LNHRLSPAAVAAGPFGLAPLLFTALGAVLLSALAPAAALAHHPFAMAEGLELSPWMGLVSGIGHPLLGPDHLLFLLAIGTIMDAGPAILILAPILAPVMIGVGIDPIHFAVVMCITLILGLITPPLGLVLFVVSGISGERIERISWDLIPYFLFEVAVVVALVLFPELVMWLPRQLGYV
jgi:TRAP-type mannitol/chloroaromatic compound transport system permease large subunit